MLNMPQVLTDFHTYVDGKGYAGIANKVSIPSIVFETIEKDLSGNAGAYDVLTGRLGKLESELQFDSFAAKEIWGLVGNPLASLTPVVIRGSLRDGPLDIGVKITMQGTWKEWSGHDFEVKAEIQSKFKLSLTKLVIEVGGDEVVYINLPLWDIRMNGKPIGLLVRANLGL
ncbi:tail tube protein [Vibrio phage 1.111.B._10N.286.45.E6]|nr:tail tube protein [Vibrio phage 1.111.A._10N.286.45.E6]AUR88283.1 tail tube protein [Vibrio phage 1.111.B._10N.286.45.E6]